MPEKLIARDYLKSFYDALEKQVSANISRAKDISNFGTGFLGVVGGGSAYFLMKDFGWCATQRTFFTLASCSAFVSFFSAVLLSFIYMRSHRREKPFPRLHDTKQIMLPLDDAALQKFEEDLYEYYDGLRVKALAKVWIFDIAFWCMIAGFVMYGVAVGLLAVFEWR